MYVRIYLTCSIINLAPCPVVISSRTCIIAADSLLVLITWFSLWKDATFRLAFGTATLAEVLLRDGKCDPS